MSRPQHAARTRARHVPLTVLLARLLAARTAVLLTPGIRR